MASRGAGPGRCHAEGRQPLAGGVRGGARWKVCVSGQVQEASGGPCSHQRARWRGPGKDGQGNLSAQLVQAVTRAGGLWVRTWETCAVCHMLLQTTLHPPASARSPRHEAAAYSEVADYLKMVKTTELSRTRSVLNLSTADSKIWPQS